MRIMLLQANKMKYTCQAYLVRGDWNSLQDVNTLIDVGVDDFIVGEIAGIPTGMGKRPVEQIVLTHGHFDHSSGAGAVKAVYGATVKAMSSLSCVDKILTEGEHLRCGDRDFCVLHTPGHSQDSLCLYCEEERVLFSGDTPLFIRTPGGSYSEDYVASLERLVRLRIDIVYPGHGTPLTGNIRSMLAVTLMNVRESSISG